MPYGLSVKLPLRLDPGDGYALTKTYKEMIQQNLKMLVLTCPGERMMDPIFGVGLRNYLFEPNTRAVHGSIESNITSQIGLYMPFLEIVSIDISDSDDDPSVHRNAIHVSLNYKIKPLDSYDVLLLSVTGN